MEKYQSKSITPVDEYVCELSVELKAFARDDLGETEEKRTAGIKAMRDWIMANPRIEKCRMDSKFILRFLRFRKYNLPLAKEAFERYLVFREGIYGYDWFSNMDYDKPNIEGLIDKGLIYVFPKRDKHGRTVVLAKLSASDPSIPGIGVEGLTLSTLVFETLLEDEENQIRGLNYILDISNIKLRHYFIFSFPTWFKFAKNVEKTCAVRHKGIHIVNIHPTLMFIAKLAMKHMPDKLRNRVQFYSRIDETKIIEKSEFPVEYDGEVEGSILTDRLKKTLETKRDFFLKYNEMKVNRSFYSEAVLNCDVDTLGTPLESTDGLKNKIPVYRTLDTEFD